MKFNTIKTGAMLDVSRDASIISGNDTANLPNDLGKIGA